MKNNIEQKIINRFSEITKSENPNVDILGKIIKNTNMSGSVVQNKRVIKLPTKILLTSAVLILITGLFNIQTVIAFIGGLFFAPGVGVTQGIDITYYGLEEPIDIETEYGLLTLKFVNKITKNGDITLAFYISSLDIPARRARDGEYPLIISINANGEDIVSQTDLLAAASWGSGGYNSVNYMYIHDNFPDVNEFDLIIDNLGIETRIVLMKQSDNFSLSEEINGITLAAGKFNGVTDMLTYDVYDSSENANDYNIFGTIFFDAKYYDDNNEEIYPKSGSGGFNPDSTLNYQLIEFYKNEREIKSLKANQLRLTYNRYKREPISIEIPIPNDGETKQVNIELEIGRHTFKITELRREGDIIYYESNSHEVLIEKGPTDMDTGSFTTQGIPNDWDEDKSAYDQAVANGESYIQFISFSPVNDLLTPVDQLIEMYQGAYPKIGGGRIWAFDENAESLTFYLAHATIIQFGDFSIEFE